MRIPQRIKSINPAPIDRINAHARKLQQDGAKIISLGQAIPDFSPVDGVTEIARQSLNEFSTHVYSADPGILELRKVLSLWLAQQNGIEADPETEIILTVGANQAFMLTLLTLLEPGDKVLLPSPFFLNHEMAVRIVGGIPIEVPLLEETGFQLRIEDIEPYLEISPRCLVIVSPNNPTGAVYNPDEMKRIAKVLAAKDIVIISDEVYSQLVYGESKHLSLASIPEIRSQIITIGSFSKTLSMTGWRLGYLVGQSDFIQEALKIQDAMIICPTVISQKTCLGVLPNSHNFLNHRRTILDQRREFLIKNLATIPNLQWHPTSGAFFAFVRVEDCTDSTQLAMEILNTVYLVTIPGRFFGKYGEGYLRLSYGSADLPKLNEACQRLLNYFSHKS